MGRFGNQVLAAGVAGGFAVALAVAGAVPAGAAPASEQIDSMRDLKGAWVTTLTGFQDGDPASWQHRLTVRKVKGAAAVGWEEWRDCTGHAAACNANKATGGGWSTPSRVLLVMGPEGTVHGVGATGTLELTPGKAGMAVVMLGSGPAAGRPEAGSPPATAAQATNPQRVLAMPIVVVLPNPGTSYAMTGTAVASAGAGD